MGDIGAKLVHLEASLLLDFIPAVRDLAAGAAPIFGGPVVEEGATSSCERVEATDSQQI